MEKEKSKGLSSFVLHIIAMSLMLCDHSWATLFPEQEWLTCIGRIAFPIFAFMIVEGYFHTSNVRKYMLRLLVGAVISEVPFNLMVASSPIYPFHQNVMWTFLIGLAAIVLIEKAKQKKKWWLTGLVSIVVVVFSFLIGTLAMVDYFGVGVLMVLVFYFFRGKKWWCYAGQFVCMVILNVYMLGGYTYNFQIGGVEIEIVQQGFALLALVPIWLYNGEQGHHSKPFQYFCYAFYPVHMLMLYVIWQFVI